MNAENVILNFLKAYKEWVDNEAPASLIFSRQHGLCNNLYCYAESLYFDGFAACTALESMFDAEGISSILPFNNTKAGQPRYCTEVHHENPWRMKWVADTIIKLEAKQNES